MKKMRLLLVLSICVCLAFGCGKSNNSGNSDNVAQENEGGNEEVNKEVNETNSLEVLNVLWAVIPEDQKFPCFGGSIENSVDGQPGQIDSSDTDMLTYTLLVPSEVQAVVNDGASIVHMMNSNTFTGACLKLEGMSTSDAASAIKDSFLNNQFVCGIPEGIQIAEYGDYVIFAYGEMAIVSDFFAGIDMLPGAAITVNELY